MKIQFSKYQGSGNDFILVDDRKNLFPIDSKHIAHLCAPKWGIGADGLILLQSSQKADFRMRIFNSDGKEAESCGNGLLCLNRFITDLGLPQKLYKIELMQGEARLKMVGDRPSVYLGEPKDLRLNLDLSKTIGHFVNTGVPHAVIFTPEVKKIDLHSLGKEFRWHSLFGPKGTNVNFAEVKDNSVVVRTFERGVEGETLACGTGAAAVAIISQKIYKLKSPISLSFPGGEVKVAFKKGFQDLQLIGSAQFVFSGTIPILNV